MHSPDFPAFSAAVNETIIAIRAANVTLLALDVGKPLHGTTDNVLEVAFVDNSWSQVITIGDNVHGAKDVDLFCIHVTAGQKLVASVTTDGLQSPDNLDVFFRLLGADGADLPTVLNSSGSVEHTFTTGGDVFAAVSGTPQYDPTVAGSGQNANDGNVGNYRLNLEIATPQPDENEPVTATRN